MNFFNAKLGEILIKAGVISHEQLSAALEEQKITKQRLGAQLITSGFISEEQLCEALRGQLHLKYIDLATATIDSEVSSLIPETLARAANMLPFERAGDLLRLAVSDPLDYKSVHDIEIHTGLTAEIYICEKSNLTNKIHDMYTTLKVVDAAKALAVSNTDHSRSQAAIEADDEQPIIRFVSNMFEQAVLMKASDIHIEPSPRNMRVRFRVDGKLLDYILTGNEISPSVCSRIKFIGGMSIAEKRIPQDGRATYNSGGKNIDLRISTLPSIFGEKIVIRITASLSFALKLDNLGFTPHNRELFSRFIRKPYGIILVTGPTGSGKSTTLYTALSEIQRTDINLVTVENPVEMLVPGVTQVNINPAQGLTFPAVLRSVLRQDPDVVMIGEIRDGETAEIATSMSITGHLVFSTLHTYDAPSAIIRLIDMGIQPFMVASSVIGVVSQRLIRKLCPECSTQHKATAIELDGLKKTEQDNLMLGGPVGCPHCSGTGYTGRTTISEIMPVTTKLRSAINAMRSSDELREIALSEGMVPIQSDARRMVLNGFTSFDEAALAVDLTE